MDADKLKKFHQLTESFITEVEKMELNEGFSDVAKAKMAGFTGGIKGFGKQIKGGFNKTVGNIANKGISTVAKGLGGDPNKSPWAKSAQDLAKKGQSQIDTGKNQAYTDKYNTYVSSAVDSLVNDLQSLNINVTNKNKLMTDIKNSITSSTKTPAGGKAPAQGGAKGEAKPAAQSTPATAQKSPTSPTKPAAQTATPVAKQQTTVTQQAPANAQTKSVLGAKGYPQMGKPPAGMKLASNGRQFVNIDAADAAQQTPENKPTAQKPVANTAAPQQDIEKQAKKKQARDKVNAQMVKKAA